MRKLEVIDKYEAIKGVFQDLICYLVEICKETVKQPELSGFWNALLCKPDVEDSKSELLHVSSDLSLLLEEGVDVFRQCNFHIVQVSNGLAVDL